MLCGMYKDAVPSGFWFCIKIAGGKDLSDFEREFIVAAQMAGASVTKTVQLACVSVETVTKVTSAFRSVGKTSVNTVKIVVDSAHLMSVMLVR